MFFAFKLGDVFTLKFKESQDSAFAGQQLASDDDKFWPATTAAAAAKPGVQIY